MRKLAKIGKYAAAGTPVGAVVDEVVSELASDDGGLQVDPVSLVLEALGSERVLDVLTERLLEHDMPAAMVISALGDQSARDALCKFLLEEFGDDDAQPEPEQPAAVTETFEDRVKRHEGYNPAPHKVAGIWHAGWGHNLEANHPPHEWRRLVQRRSFTEQQCKEWFAEDICAAEGRFAGSCRVHDVNPDTMPEHVRDALIEMAFQLGSTRNWRNMWSAIRGGDYEAAAKHALSSGKTHGQPSRWFLQTPERAAEVAGFLSDRKLEFAVGYERGDRSRPVWTASKV